MEKITVITMALCHNKKTIVITQTTHHKAVYPICHVVLKYRVAQARCLQVALNQVQFCSGSVCQTDMAGFCAL